MRRSNKAEILRLEQALVIAQRGRENAERRLQEIETLLRAPDPPPGRYNPCVTPPEFRRAIEAWSVDWTL